MEKRVIVMEKEMVQKPILSSGDSISRQNENMDVQVGAMINAWRKRARAGPPYSGSRITSRVYKHRYTHFHVYKSI